MFCGNCGGKNADNARFCASCGKPTGPGAAPPAPSPPPRYAPPPPPQQQIPQQPQYAPQQPYPQQAYPQQPAPQAAYGGAPPMAGAPRPDISAHFGLAIVSTVLCCLPLGVIGIVYASQVKAKLAAGDYAGAAAASSKAKTFSILGMVIGGIGIVIYGIIAAEQISKSM